MMLDKRQTNQRRASQLFFLVGDCLKRGAQVYTRKIEKSLPKVTNSQFDATFCCPSLLCHLLKQRDRPTKQTLRRLLTTFKPFRAGDPTAQSTGGQKQVCSSPITLTRVARALTHLPPPVKRRTISI